MKFKKIIILALVVCTVISLAACSSKSEAPDGMKNVAREENPFNLYVPQSWMTNSGDVVGAYYSIYDKSNITIMPYGGDFASTDEYWEDFKTRCAAEFAEFEVIKEKENKVVAQRNAHQFVYKLKVDGTAYQCQQTVLSYGNLLYVITYTATADVYESHLADIENMLGVFEFKQ